jgi:hypothetical protein
VGLSRLIPLIQALVACVQTEALAYAADPQWCLSPFASLATVPLALTGAGLVSAIAAFIILCFFCCCSVRPGMMARYGAGQPMQPQFLSGAAANGNGGAFYPANHDPEAGGATYWDEKAGRLVPGPGPAPLSSARTAGSGGPASLAPPQVVVPVAAYAPAVPASSPPGEPMGAPHDYPQVTPSV